MGERREFPRPVRYAGQTAKLFVSSGQLHKALRSVEESLHQELGHPAALALRREIRLLEQREKRRRQAPRNAQAHLEVGFSYLQLRRTDEAIFALDRARALFPDLYLAQLLGVALHSRGRAAEARLAYERAAQPRAGDEMAHSLLAALNHGEPPPYLAEEYSHAKHPSLSLSA